MDYTIYSHFIIYERFKLINFLELEKTMDQAYCYTINYSDIREYSFGAHFSSRSAIGSNLKINK